MRGGGNRLLGITSVQDQDGHMRKAGDKDTESPRSILSMFHVCHIYTTRICEICGRARRPLAQGSAGSISTRDGPLDVRRRVVGDARRRARGEGATEPSARFQFQSLPQIF